MLTHLDPASALAVALLIFALVMVILFEATNGFHDAANAVATVIYTKSLRPGLAVVWSGLMNFVGVLVGGITVAYALVELLPTEALSPPGGGPAVAMLVSLFAAALTWNIGTWWFALPNSSSHCLIGSLLGVALGNALVHSRSLADGVHWHQMIRVLEALALSPLLGFVLAGALYLLTRRTVHDPHLYEPAGEHPPVWWMRAILVVTCTGVSFAHGTNDGQKSIGLIMLTTIGLFPATYALNPEAGRSLAALPDLMRQAEPLLRQFGDEQKAAALAAVRAIEQQGAQDIGVTRFAALGRKQTDTGNPPPSPAPPAARADLAQRRTNIRADVYSVISQLQHVQDAAGAGAAQKKEARELDKAMGATVEYAPGWVRLLSALCLGIGTMIGYRRIVTTLGERLGNVHLTPAQGASAELVAAAVIGVAGFTGMPVSTTHIVTSGIGGTMVSAGAGLRYGMLSRIVTAWILTLPVTIVVAGGLYYVLANPRFWAPG
jgi:inorganic phosphate transporter, PiT family